MKWNGSDASYLVDDTPTLLKYSQFFFVYFLPVYSDSY